MAEPHERAALMGVFYIESYLANSVPTIAGYPAQRAGLLTAVNVTGAVIAVLAAYAIASLSTQARSIKGKKHEKTQFATGRENG